MTRKNIIIIHRWAESLVDYASFINPNKYKVHYIVNSLGKRGINSNNALVGRVFELEDLNQIEALIKCTQEIIAEFGEIYQIIAPSECDLTQAACLRTKFNISGMQAEEIKFFRDKVAMKTKVKAGGVPIPEFLECCTVKDNILSFAERVGYPVILKPKDGGGSEGVYLVHSQEQLNLVLSEVELSNYECEQYIEGPIFHINGLIHNHKIIFIKNFQYLNTCLEFKKGKPMGGVIIDDKVLNETLVNFTRNVLIALELNNSAFHLEVILKDGKYPVFLEIGARVGGGKVCKLIQDLYGINLVQEWIEMQLNEFSGLNITENSIVGGELLIPEPQATPCRVVSCKQNLGTIPTLYQKILPEPGEIFDGEGGFHHVSGTFLYKGISSEQVQADMEKTINSYEIKCERLEMELIASY